MSDLPLDGRVCLVTGASRGIGKGIAQALGDAGAIVYVTGRTTRDSTPPGTAGAIEDVADDVTARGGRGIAVPCDHADVSQVSTLYERIRSQHAGRLDLVVSNAWGGYEAYDHREFSTPFWEQPFEKRWRGMFEAGVKSHLLACQHAARLMVGQETGLIVVTLSWDRDRYYEQYPNVFYYAATQAIRRAVHAMAADLRREGVSVVGLAPGFTRTEKVLGAFGIDESGWKDVEALAMSESPLYSGRAVVALASDPNIATRSGEVFKTGSLAPEYGFTDADGRVVPPFEPPI